MPLFHCNFFAHSLGSPCNVQVFLPTFSDPSAEGFHALYPHRDHRVLYLLHGMNGDDTVWLRKTNVERYAQDHGLALVMPAVQNSFYTDAPLGGAYFRFLTEELPAMLHASFPLSKKREDTFLVGYSMGGYGALKAALTYPERYAAVASFSGALVIEAIAKKAEEMGALPLFQSVFGDPSALHGGKHDLLHLAARALSEKKDIPKIYLSCGAEDELCLPMNRYFCKQLTELGVPFSYQEEPGEHNWDFWESQIRDFVPHLTKA